MNEKLFSKVDVKVQKKSGFDKSHQNLLTTKCGTLTPILCDEVIPNSTVDLKLNLSASLPPLASDTFMRVDLKAEAFFVPYRLCYGGFEKWYTGDKVQLQPVTATSSQSKYNVIMPVMQLSTWNEIEPGTLADYLGYRAAYDASSFASGATAVNPLPFVAYHKIWDEWYRNPLVQNSAFLPLTPNISSLNANGGLRFNAGTLPSFTYTDNASQAGFNKFYSNSNYAGLNDGKHLTDLRQRNFGYDYFTTATPNAQNGTAQKISFSTTASTGQFTISALRAANSLQQFLERNNLAGNRYVDQLRAQYGANLNDGIAQRPLLLGSASFNVYSKGIYQTANNDSAVANPNNPFSQSVGAQFGSAYASGSDFIIKGFTANEPGLIMVLVSLVPKVTYSTGIRRMLTHYIGDNRDGKDGLVDLANPILQNTGNQPIFGYELNGIPSDTSVFGYTDRYAEWKSMDDELHGLVRDGSSLESFALQRSFVLSGNSIGSNFLEIPTSYMDPVAAVIDSISDYGCWIDSYLDYKVSMPLAEYAIPSLQDPAYEHGVDVSISRGGTHL